MHVAEAIEAKGVQPLMEILDDLGGWPILGRNWSEQTFDWLETVTKLRVLHNSVLVTSWLSIDPGNSSQYALQVRDPLFFFSLFYTLYP
jgi:hypothetical protein